VPKLPLEPTLENIEKAKRFVLKKWIERFHERYPGLAKEHPGMVPHDLTDSCKFTSLFAQALFGGEIMGSYDHQYLSLNGQVIDLNADAADVRELGQAAYDHDHEFFGNPDHRESLKSCMPRVKDWVAEFLKQGAQTLDEDYEFDTKDDPFEPRPMQEPRALYRSVSLPELEDIFERGEVVGGQNRFNDFEHRRWVFFGDRLTDQLIAQGEEIDRQASHALRDTSIHREYRVLSQQMEELSNRALATLARASVDINGHEEYEVREGTYYAFMQLARRLPMEERRGWFSLGDRLRNLREQAEKLTQDYQTRLDNMAQSIETIAKERKATSAVIVTKPLSGGLHYSASFGRSGFQTDEYGFHPGQVKASDIEHVIFIKDGKRVASCPAWRAQEVLRKIMGKL
jgi:hypothetical protein